MKHTKNIISPLNKKPNEKSEGAQISSRSTPASLYPQAVKGQPHAYSRVQPTVSELPSRTELFAWRELLRLSTLPPMVFLFLDYFVGTFIRGGFMQNIIFSVAVVAFIAMAATATVYFLGRHIIHVLDQVKINGNNFLLFYAACIIPLLPPIRGILLGTSPSVGSSVAFAAGLFAVSAFLFILVGYVASRRPAWSERKENLILLAMVAACLVAGIGYNLSFSLK